MINSQTLGLAKDAPLGGSIAPNYHPAYLAKLPIWGLTQDAFDNNIKRYAQKYLVCPPGAFQKALNNSAELEVTIRSLTVPVAEYSNWPPAAIAYAAGGFEPDLMPRTNSGFMSLIGQHAPVTEVPDQISYIINSATKDNKSLENVYLRTTQNVLLKGRAPLLLDIQNNKIKIVEYSAEALIDWDAIDVSSDSSKFKYAIFKDVIENPEFDPMATGGSDNFNRYYDIYHYHHLVDGVYTVRSVVENDMYLGEKDKTVTPNYMGKTLDFIPLIAIGSTDNTPDVDAVPLVGIANCTTAIYDLACMLKHAEKTSAVPTMYLTGVTEDEAPTVTGAGVCIVLPDYTSKVGYTITDTSAMTHIKARMADYYMQAQELGASLLGSSQTGAESGEALRLRQASATATLKSIVDNVGSGITKLLEMASDWAGTNPEDASFEPNKEFSTFALTANETIALVQTWQSGAIAHSTLLENFRKAGMLKAGETTEEEMKSAKESDEMYVDKGAVASSSGNELDVAQSLPKSNTMNKNV